MRCHNLKVWLPRITSPLLCRVLAVFLLCFSALFRRSTNYSGCQVRPQSVSLITTIWADPQRHAGHRKEVFQALFKNLANPWFHKVFVVVDGQDSVSTCEHLARKVRGQLRDKLRCTAVSKRPTYFDMFSHAKLAEGPIVVLANADMVFDESARVLGLLKNDTVLTISTAGSNLALDVELGGRPWPNLRAPTRCIHPATETLSWDAFAFYPENIHVQKGLWMDEKTNLEYYMNTMFAENCALHDLFASSQRLKNVFQICEYVRMWHHHQEPKTYSSDEAWVQGTPLFPTSPCKSLCECLGH